MKAGKKLVTDFHTKVAEQCDSRCIRHMLTCKRDVWVVCQSFGLTNHQTRTQLQATEQSTSHKQLQRVPCCSVTYYIVCTCLGSTCPAVDAQCACTNYHCRATWHICHCILHVPAAFSKHMCTCMHMRSRPGLAAGHITSYMHLYGILCICCPLCSMLCKPSHSATSENH